MQLCANSISNKCTAQLYSTLVAATGLPEPQKDHAVRMSRFANACMQSMGVMTSEMSETLGPDTANLKLRVGLHSGKITGGVLKGDKCRFQLFGDTMNTARYVEFVVGCLVAHVLHFN